MVRSLVQAPCGLGRLAAHARCIILGTLRPFPKVAAAGEPPCGCAHPKLLVCDPLWSRATCRGLGAPVCVASAHCGPSCASPKPPTHPMCALYPVLPVVRGAPGWPLLWIVGPSRSHAQSLLTICIWGPCPLVGSTEHPQAVSATRGPPSPRCSCLACCALLVCLKVQSLGAVHCGAWATRSC